MPYPLTRLGLRLRSLFLKARVEQELDEELRYHLEREVEERLAAGLTPEKARLSARRSLGPIAKSMEECRDMRRVSFIEHRVHDLRFAVRQLSKHRGFAYTAILVLALGIAANVAIFGFVDAALIKPLPYQEPSRLVTAFSTRPETAQGQARGSVSYLNFLDWRERNHAFSAIAAYDVRAGFTLATPAGPQRVPGLRVTAGFFRTLGVTPVLGREFHRDEEGPAAPATVVLSYSTWQTRFGGRRDVLGQTVTLQSDWLSDGEQHVVIGVLPRDFHFPMASHADFWATIRGRQACWDVPSCQSLETVARLADGVSPQTASASLTAIVEQLRRQYPDQHADPEIAKLVPLREVMIGDVRPILLTFLAGAGLVLLISCINIVSLLLVRSDSRTREIAVRNALGASSARLVLQFAAEALVLVVAGSACGLLLAAWGMRFLRSLLSTDMISNMPYLQEVGLNLRVVAFACAVSLVAAVVFAVTPVVRISMSERLVGLKEGGRGAAGTTWRRLGSHLVVAELAVALILLVTAGLLGKSLDRLLHVDTGFNTRHLASLGVSVASVRSGSSTAKSTSAKAEQPGLLARQVADRVSALPGVAAVGYADMLPLSVLAPSSTFWIPGRPEQDQLKESWPVRRVSAGYFTALQARLLRGRHFTYAEVADAPTDNDAGSTRLPIIINETAVRRYFRGEDPIGRSIAIGGRTSAPREIIGIVADIKEGPPQTPAHPAGYVPFNYVDFGLVVRTSQTGRSVFPSLLAAIHEVRPDLLVGRPTTMVEGIRTSPAASLHRSSAWLIGGFAGVAFLLSVVGLYGVVAYSVGLRTREIGVRMALGAQRRSVYQLVLGDAARLVAVGTGVGLICAVGTATLMRNLFFGVQSWDLPTLTTAAAVLILSALLASYIPARRAASVSPVEVLRAE
ncbi:MAG: FtsX-like permease family protein [Luteitalea sp.]|nr:FtsX-like permease family protein [Luteitalea sp.]